MYYAKYIMKHDFKTSWSAGRYPQQSRPSKQRNNDKRRSLRSPRGRTKQKSTNGFSPAGYGDNQPGAAFAVRKRPTPYRQPSICDGLPQRPIFDQISGSPEMKIIMSKLSIISIFIKK